MRRKSIILLALSVGCGPDATWFDETWYEMESIEGKEWHGGMLFIFRASREMSVFAGCNGMDGPYHLTDGRLVAERLSMSEKGCGPAVLHQQDEWMQDFLLGAPTYELDGPRLILSDDEVTLVLLDEEVANPDRSLVGSAWEIDGLVDGGLVMGVEGSTLVFGDDGRLAIDGPCAGGAADYVADEHFVTLANVSIDPPECPNDELGLAMDEHLREVLVDGPLAWEIDATRLILGDPQLGLSLHTE